MGMKRYCRNLCVIKETQAGTGPELCAHPLCTRVKCLAPQNPGEVAPASDLSTCEVNQEDHKAILGYIVCLGAA